VRATLGLVIALIVVGCATRPLTVERFGEIPGFVPYEEYVIWVNRKLAIMSEGTGAFTTGARFYYIAYMTGEEIPDTKPYPESGSTEALNDPLWGEMQSLWKVRRLKLNPAEYAIVIIDARAFPGTPGSKTRRVVYGSDGANWYWEQIRSVVFEAQ
jgi:hypothetical protein